MSRKELSFEEAEELLRRITEADALELYEVPGKTMDVLIPYVMNDAVECYLKFENASLRGTRPSGALRGAEAKLSQAGTGMRRGLFVSLSSGQVISIWFDRIFLCGQSYQYHRIGHDWRTAAGEENIRRLVNLLCVIHDKYTYLGREYCNEAELRLQALAEFGPLRFYSPIDESILEWYPETAEGSRQMEEIAEACGDEEFRPLLRRYAAKVKNGDVTEKMVEALAAELKAPAHARIIQEIGERITKASTEWEERYYGEAAQAEMDRMRKDVAEPYLQAGFSGSYPFLSGLDEQGRTIRVEFVEEHPFTIMESQEYHFRIFSMHIRTDDNKVFSMKQETGKREDCVTTHS